MLIAVPLNEKNLSGQFQEDISSRNCPFFLFVHARSGRAFRSQSSLRCGLSASIAHAPTHFSLPPKKLQKRQQVCALFAVSKGITSALRDALALRALHYVALSLSAPTLCFLFFRFFFWGSSRGGGGFGSGVAPFVGCFFRLAWLVRLFLVSLFLGRFPRCWVRLVLSVCAVLARLFLPRPFGLAWWLPFLLPLPFRAVALVVCALSLVPRFLRRRFSSLVPSGSVGVRSLLVRWRWSARWLPVLALFGFPFLVGRVLLVCCLPPFLVGASLVLVRVLGRLWLLRLVWGFPRSFGCRLASFLPPVGSSVRSVAVGGFILNLLTFNCLYMSHVYQFVAGAFYSRTVALKELRRLRPFHEGKLTVKKVPHYDTFVYYVVRKS